MAVVVRTGKKIPVWRLMSGDIASLTGGEVFVVSSVTEVGDGYIIAAEDGRKFSACKSIAAELWRVD